MGVAAGNALAWAVGRVLASQRWGVSGYDPVTLCGVIALLNRRGAGGGVRAIGARGTGGSGCVFGLGVSR
jgi:hypothetical protein